MTHQLKMKELLTYLSYTSHLLPVIFYFLFLKRNKKRELRVIFLYAIASFLTDTILISFNAKQYPVLNFTVLSIFTFLEFFFLTTFIYLNVSAALFKKIILFSGTAFIIFCISHYIFKLGNQKFDTLPASIESLLVLIYCILYFVDNVNQTRESFLYESYQFWIIVGILLYLAGTLFLFIFSSSFTASEMHTFWNINYFLNILKNLLFAIAFFMKKETTNNLTMQNRYNIWEKQRYN